MMLEGPIPDGSFIITEEKLFKFCAEEIQKRQFTSGGFYDLFMKVNYP